MKTVITDLPKGLAEFIEEAKAYGIKLYTEPLVHVVGRTQVVPEGIESFLESNNLEWTSDATNDFQFLTEVAGRLCYMSFNKPRPGGNKAYIENILAHKHGSVLEHCSFNFIVEHVSRSLTHELVRHRVGTAYSQLSQRYVDESDVGFVIPKNIQKMYGRGRVFMDWYTGMLNSLNTYKEVLIGLERAALEDAGFAFKSNQAFLSRLEQEEVTQALADFKKQSGHDAYTHLIKSCRQEARSVLLNAAETKVFFTANLRTLRNIVEQRGTTHADAEIRHLAEDLIEAVHIYSPDIVGDHTVTELGDGSKAIQFTHSKV